MPPKNKSNVKEIILKKNKSKKNIDESDVEDSDEEIIEEDEELEEEDELQEDENISIINEDDNKSYNEESDNDNSSESEDSDNNSKDENNDENNENYIDAEETLSKKCIKKYVSMEDDINLEELFGDEDNNIIKQDRITKPILTKYEKVRILSTRIKQLQQGAKPMLKNYSGLSAREMALEELKHKIIPLIIERPVPNVGIEKWKLSELEILD
jgi:DNA-directed RNA polymerase I, II, and III subunit RPABC2